MHRLEEEDPSIRYSRDPQTKELLLSGQGQLHIEVTVAKLKRRFGVDVNLKPPRIPYRETIKASTEAHGRHKKQTGGHGQFGDCKIKVEPLRARRRLRVRRRHLRRLDPAPVHAGGRKGHPGTRGRAAISPAIRWSTSASRSSTARTTTSTRTSCRSSWPGSLAFKDAMTRARPTILEPIMNVEVYAPSDFAGDLMGDLNGRRGRIAGMDTRGATTIIKAQVPMSEMLTYEQHLTSATGGRGSYHMEYSHYDEVPAHLQSKIIAAAKAESGQGVEAGRGVSVTAASLVGVRVLGAPRGRAFARPGRAGAFGLLFRRYSSAAGFRVSADVRPRRETPGDALLSLAPSALPSAASAFAARGLNSLPTSLDLARLRRLSPLRKPSRSRRV